MTALEIPYKGGELSMLLLIPDEIEGLAAIEGALDAKKLDALVSELKGELVLLALPRFEVNPGASLSLGEDLKDPLVLQRADEGCEVEVGAEREHVQRIGDGELGRRSGNGRADSAPQVRRSGRRELARRR